MPRHNPGGALRRLTDEKFGGRTEARESDVTVGVAVVRLANNNPERVLLSITNHGAADVVVAFNRSVTVTTGIIAGSGGGSITFVADEDADPTGWELSAISSGAGNSVHVLEIVRSAVAEKPVEGEG